jgi:hypothetical protein
MTRFYKSRPLLWRAAAAILFALAYLFVEAHAAPLKIAPTMSTARSATQRGFDHSKFNALLASAVANGRVDYPKFKNNANFNAYLSSLETAKVVSLSADEQLAFWINAYNALVIKNVLDNPGMRRPIDVAGFFDTRRFKVTGKMLTLNDIETSIRKQFKEPLIHFGLVCAARSCPPLQPAAYTAANVRAQLAHNASAYLASQYNRYDASNRALALSKIFDWYRDDFGGDAGVRTFVKKYGTEGMKQGLAANPNARITYLEYDWNINAR